MSPKTKTQVAIDRQASQEKILNASLTLFAKIGYDKTSIRMIAQEAEIALGLLYNYFPSKEAVLTSIFEQSAAHIKQSFIQPNQDASPHQQLSYLIDNIFSIITQNLAFWQLFYSIRMQQQVQQLLQPGIDKLLHAMFEELSKIISKLYPKKTAAEIRTFIALIDGIGNHYAMDPENYPLAKVIEVIKEKYSLNS